MAPLRFLVSEADAGARLDRLLAARPEVGSRALAERLIAAGHVRVDGVQRAKSHRLAPGDVILAEPFSDVAPGAAAPAIRIVWEDEHLFVVDKQAGIVVHPAGTTTTGTLAHGLVAHGAAGGEHDRPGIVHRLDRDTSGLMLVARSETAHRALQRLIRRREVERRYLALVRGEPQSRTGLIDAAVGRDRRDRTRHSVDTDTPRAAVTWFEVLELLGPRALLELRLETGRTHQLRVHLEAIGLPVCGDLVYGVPEEGLERQFLHAHRLRFVHPFGGEALDLASPLPPELEAALDRARAAPGQQERR